MRLKTPFYAGQLFCLVLSFFVSNLFAQPVNNLIGTTTMPSPEASSLGSFIDIPIGYYTGTPSVGIPVTTVQEGSLSLPISLNYHASGVRVVEPSSCVGTGWALSAGGRVMRTVLGLPDEDLDGFFNTMDEIQSIYGLGELISFNPSSGEYQWNANVFDSNIDDLVKEIHSGTKDGEADVFSYSFGNYSGKFYFSTNSEGDLEVQMIPKNNIDVEVHLSSSYSIDRLEGFTFTTPDGAKYHFGIAPDEASVPVVEKTQRENHTDWSTAYLTSWMLVRVTSFDGVDVIDLEYEPEAYEFLTTNPRTGLEGLNCNAGFGGPAVSADPATSLYEIRDIVGVLQPSGAITSGPGQDDSYFTYTGLNVQVAGGGILSCDDGISRMRIESYRLKDIHYTYGDVSFEYETGARTDLDVHTNSSHTAAALSEIKVRNGIVVCKNVVLDQSYWQDTRTPFDGPFENTAVNYRLRLDRVVENSCDGSIQHPYDLKYIGEEDNFLPNRLTKATDHWGYYNGADANNDIPEGLLNIPEINETIASNWIAGWMNGYVESATPGTVSLGNYDPADAVGYDLEGKPLFPHLVHYSGRSDRNTHEQPMKLGALRKITYPLGGSYQYNYEANDYYQTYEQQIGEIATINYSGTGGFTIPTNPSSISFNDASPDLERYQYRLEAYSTSGISSAELRAYDATDPSSPVAVFPIYFNEGSLALYRRGAIGSLFNNQLLPFRTYRIELFITGGGMSVNFDIFDTQTEVISENTKVGGLRLKAMRIDDANGNITNRSYSYADPDNENISSGELYRAPSYWHNGDMNFVVVTVGNGPGANVLDVDYPGGALDAFIEESITPLSDFQGNHIGYHYVREDHHGNGWKDFHFLIEDVAPDLSQNPNRFGLEEYPYAPEPLLELTGKMTSGGTYSEEGALVGNSSQSPVAGDYEEGPIRMVKTAPYVLGLAGFIWKRYKNRTRIPYLIEEKSSTVDGATLNSSYEYDGITSSFPHYFATAVEIANLDGIHRTEYKYAVDFNHQSLLEKNMIGIPLQETKSVGSSFVGGFRKRYNSICYPVAYYEIFEDGNEFLRGSIDTYVDGQPSNYQSTGYANLDYDWDTQRRLDGQTYLNWYWDFDYYGNTGFLRKKTDFDGLHIDYKYDDLGRLKEIKEHGGYYNHL